MSNVRLRRLQADHQNLVEYVRHHPRLRLIQAIGDPPELYQIEYRIKSLRQVGDELEETMSHLVEISLPRNYPRTPPLCRMLTPVFHPNIAPHAICVGDHWSAGEPLKSIVTRIGEMLAFQSYNVKSPLNGEAARWVEEHQERLPLDKVSLLVEEDQTVEASTEPSMNFAESNTLAPVSGTQFPEPQVGSQSASASSPVLDVVFDDVPIVPREIRVACPNCSTQFQLAASNVGKKARCNRCQTVFAITQSDAIE